ncbi:Translation initiation factor 3 subunit b [Mortierella antarctica]|nr:Translation initiation factor 3 subunit b [Mortierella antarctica]
MGGLSIHETSLPLVAPWSREKEWYNISSNIPQDARDIATKSLAHTAAIHHARTIAQGKDFGPSAALGTSSAAEPTPKPLRREIYDSRQKCLDDLPGILVFSEDGDAASPQNLSDESARNVYEHFQRIYDFYLKDFNRNSYDGKGAKIVLSVHFDGDPNPGYDNSFWLPASDPKQSQWVFGDGDFTLMNNFTKILDISAHDFTHAVIEHTAILPFFFQSGALHESIADVFGSMIKQYFAPGGPQKAEDADWLVGEGIWLVPGGRALRDMENPGAAYDIAGITKDRQWRDRYVELPF